MKKFVVLLLSFVLCITFTSSFTGAKEQNNIEILSKPRTVEETEYLESLNYTFSQAELVGTEYSGHKVEVIEGQMYVDDRVVLTTVVWIKLVNASVVVAGWIASGQFQQAVNAIQLTSDAIDGLMTVWGGYKSYDGGMTDMYLNQQQRVTSFRTSGGNECVRISGQTFACKYSM